MYTQLRLNIHKDGYLLKESADDSMRIGYRS